MDYPGSSPFACPAIDLGETPGEEEQAQASQLGSGAAQAVILGDLDRARELLARATEVDPSSAELAYRYARILEDSGERNAAISELCRVLATGSEAEGVQDAQDRVEALAAEDRAAIPDEAIEAYRVGVTWADTGLLEDAAESLAMASAEAPLWADAYYNRGVVLTRLGRGAEAAAELRRYLDLAPDAADAIAVSERIGQLESLGSLPSPGTAMTLGVLLPGMGQFYSGRALGGFTVLALAGGAAAAGFLIKEIEVQCLANVPPGGDCPPDRIRDEVTTTPYLAPALGAAAVVAVVGAVEAYVKARRRQSSPEAAAGEPGTRSARLAAPTVTSRGSRLTFSFLRVTF